MLVFLLCLLVLTILLAICVWGKKELNEKARIAPIKLEAKNLEEAKKKIKVEDEENRMSVEDIAIGLPATDGNQTTDRAETHGPEPVTTRNLV